MNKAEIYKKQLMNLSEELTLISEMNKSVKDYVEEDDIDILPDAYGSTIVMIESAIKATLAHIDHHLNKGQPPCVVITMAIGMIMHNLSHARHSMCSDLNKTFEGLSEDFKHGH